MTVRKGAIPKLTLSAAAIAGAAGLPLSSHLYPRVSVQLLRVSETVDCLEWSDWAEPILAEPFTVCDGYVTVADMPGNSLEWNEDSAAIRDLACANALGR
jgi:mandelate racemase